MINYIFIFYLAFIIIAQEILSENQIYYLYGFIAATLISYILNRIFGNPFLRFEQYIQRRNKGTHTLLGMSFIPFELILTIVLIISTGIFLFLKFFI
ncbi:hypothetical protein CP965_08920 [Halarcobacter mediterraneus]|uniref:Uncharacterized protein n=1 Tax=Halarcobacter mediterraneus TaxID=2023153 RepID=A0A4Q1AVP5_9BACT|nr:hypothetical protein CP965_08920 [Halarcobacter mediterraneus]